MSTIKRCDVGDCMDNALFMVAVYKDGNELLEDSLDVCGADHAKEAIGEWLKTLADIEDAS